MRLHPMALLLLVLLSITGCATVTPDRAPTDGRPQGVRVRRGRSGSILTRAERPDGGSTGTVAAGEARRSGTVGPRSP
ncbi:hypothetical protein ACF06L_30175 [Streptomyces sp. NPDC015408]|uniref:hypothetical protein n=1 Tax=Streptomyces sp. NPDC015408 TaxID=3364956 RepID=UPI0037015704